MVDNRRAFLTGAVGVGAGAVVGGLAQAPAYAAVVSGADPGSVNVLDHNADPTGVRPSDDAFRAAAAELLASFQATSYSSQIPRKVLVIPPGNYLITQPDCLLPNVDGGERNARGDLNGVVDGISITGYGKRVSTITYAPTADDTTLWTNKRRYKNIRISGLSFHSTNPTSSFNYSYSDAAGLGVQDTWYTDVEWRGDWTRGIGLDGSSVSNLNSEMGWDHCQVSGTYSDAFLVMGMTPIVSQQDQFLNYWFRECKVEFQSGVFVRNNRGGSMNFIGGSYILIDEHKAGTFFKLERAVPSRADSVMRLYAQGVRFELRCDLHKVIDSAWYKGHITFESCDDTARAFQGFAAGTLTHAYDFTLNGSRGPMVRYVDCALMGRHEVTTSATPTTAGKVLYDGSRFANRSTGILSWTGATPRYEYRDCLAGAVYLADEKRP
ncbi:hypothetical protein Lfu02_62300 [Longispora fulva]|uniref:Pectate lyase superfamily protein domain-containing protein n=1 Tax=Longispora fulva TaxID=619741 RepID=A0A8J7G821_9ACTN|nr:hypothetical protein [Longispora fulva]MBG6134650.1 hypothetical protein [Longispora fulva]GIG61858.1 hypothetical protein Lfu02_62300 [Longispora fulva]